MNFTSRLARFFSCKQPSRDSAPSGAADSRRASGTAGATTSKDATGQTATSATATESRHATLATEADARALATESKYGWVDDTTARPWSAICHLQIRFSKTEEPIHASGFLFSETMVVTAAHNLRKRGIATAPTSISIRVGKHDPIPLKGAPDLSASDYHIRYHSLFADLEADSDRRSYYDYGVILLRHPIKPRPSFLFALSGLEPDDERWNRPLVCAGYLLNRSLQDEQPELEDSELIQLHQGRGAAWPKEGDRFLGDEKNLVRHTAYAEVGISGGPLFLLGDETVVGIQVKSFAMSGDNGAVRITKTMVDTFYQWDHEYRQQLGSGREDLIA
jgi:V8-like Glu-specific endopeptidase